MQQYSMQDHAALHTYASTVLASVPDWTFMPGTTRRSEMFRMH